MQIDIAFGDVITPASEMLEYHSLLEMPAARVQAYPKETVVSEKVQAASSSEYAKQPDEGFLRPPLAVTVVFF